MRKFDTIKDCDGNTIQSGDKIYYKCKHDNLIREGTIHHMIGGSFGVEGPRYRMIYSYNEVKPYSIRKINPIKT
tara:strand:- start:2891 stop:3112 length:222 start_codon:yes stop_codon:yes gene_type:complete